jgi:hypothetical protein
MKYVTLCLIRFGRNTPDHSSCRAGLSHRCRGPKWHQACSASSFLALYLELSVLVQMPRGNLETIFPRALILCANRRLLDALSFKEVPFRPLFSAS